MEKVTIHLQPEIEDLVEDWLWIQGALTIATKPRHEPQRSLEALFEKIDAEQFGARLTEALCHCDTNPPTVTFATVDEQAWQVSWRENFKPLEVGGFRLVGEWEAPDFDPKTVLIYPGQAFGTGQHETTRLMIERLQQLQPVGKRVLDIGCGSGILSIVAERLGAVAVLGFDADPDCAENMTHHLVINKTCRTSLRIARLEEIGVSIYDLVLANITLNVLEEVWPQLAPYLAKDGVLLNSGILVSQKKQAVASLARAGFHVTLVRELGEWLLIEAVRS